MYATTATVRVMYAASSYFDTHQPVRYPDLAGPETTKADESKFCSNVPLNGQHSPVSETRQRSSHMHAQQAAAQPHVIHRALRVGE